MEDKKYTSMDVKDYKIEEEDREALAGLSPVPQPPRKVQSYSQQLRGPSGSKTHHHKTRQRSLEEIPKPTCTSGAPISSDQCYDSDDEFFHQTSSNAAATSPSYSIYPLNISSSTSDKDSTNLEDNPLLRHCQPLPEFLASGGTGVFKAPNRCAVHPGRPPCLELRPHPLRETQVGKFLRNIACTDTQLWAGLECGVRYWSFENAYEPGCGLGGRVRRGDEDAAPFHESSNTPPTMCLLIDDATGLVWTGHKDGKIRSWKMDQTSRDADDADTTTTDPPPPVAGNRNSSNLNNSANDVFNNNNNINNSISSSSSDISNNYNSSSNYNYNENKEKDAGGNDAHSIKEGLTWQAHKNPVLSLVMSSQGDLWSGSEGGVIKIWPWDTIEKSLLFKSGEKRMASLLVERSQIDLRAQVTVNGACRISSSDIKCLLSDNVRAKVWCAQSVFFSLWDARTKDLLKVFNIDGQIENRVDLLSAQEKGQGQGQDQPAEDEMKVKFVSSSSSKKEKSQGFLQRSRNAIMGAADAVRRVATRGAGAFAEDNKRTEAIVLTADGMVWSGCSNGLLVQWDGNGNRLQDFTHHSCAVQCFCTFGSRLYVGYVSGIIQILDLEGNLIAVWVAHSNPVLKLAVGNGHVYSLATHGGIRGWNISSPGPLDSILRAELAGRELAYTRQDSIRILIGTWNVGQGRASPDALMSWLGSTVSDVGIVVVGLQEVDMGAGFLAMSAAKETVGLEGSSVGHWWMDAIGKAIGEGLTFERMGSRQLAGLLISLWVRKNLRTHVGDVDAAAVPCGFGRAIGNKGGVGLRIRVHDRIMCFVNCHLAAHLEAVNRRNADFDHIFRNMAFSRTSNLTAAAGVTTATQTLKNTNAVGANSEEPKPDLSEADMVVFTGDFNYRLFGISYDEARDFVSQRTFDWLREKDQLRAEMKAGKVFQGMREALITFPPTYKFERGQPGLGGYDSGEKKRIPAWCDRVIYRDSRTSSVSECGLECPVVSSVIQYDACMDVNESDHKPVRCKFHVQISHVDRSVRRQEFGEIIKCNEEFRSLLEELRYVPEATVSTTNIVLQNQDTSVLRITNKCVKEKAIFKIICEGQSTIKDDGEVADYRARGCYGYPRWLEVLPAAGIIKPDNFVDISVHHEELHTLEEYVDGVPDTWWCEDTRDKEVILVVVVQGSSSTDKQTHRIHVRHCFSAKAVRIDSRSNSSKKGKRAGSSVHRSET